MKSRPEIIDVVICALSGLPRDLRGVVPLDIMREFMAPEILAATQAGNLSQICKALWQLCEEHLDSTTRFKVVGTDVPILCILMVAVISMECPSQQQYICSSSQRQAWIRDLLPQDVNVSYLERLRKLSHYHHHQQQQPFIEGAIDALCSTIESVEKRLAFELCARRIVQRFSAPSRRASSCAERWAAAGCPARRCSARYLCHHHILTFDFSALSFICIVSKSSSKNNK